MSSWFPFKHCNENGFTVSADFYCAPQERTSLGEMGGWERASREMCRRKNYHTWAFNNKNNSKT